MSTLRPPKEEWVREDGPGLTTWLVNGNWKEHPPNSTSRRYVTYQKGLLAVSQGNDYHQIGRTLNNIGGDFQVFKKEYKESSSLGTGPLHFSYSLDPLEDGMEHWFAPQVAIGPDIPSSGWPWPTATPSSFFQLDALGTTAISRVLPTNPTANATTALGELLLDGLPRFGIDTWKRRTEIAKDAGSDYLNYEFGWKPLVGDIRSFARAVKNREKILKRYEAESGKLLHRRYDYQPILTESVQEWTGALPVPRLIDALDLPNCSEARLVLRQTTSVKRWMEATFMYTLPPKGSVARDYRLADKLLGVQLTPEVVWELTPWSWAMDWVTNTGDIVRNFSAFLMDGLVMPWAYMMEHVKCTNEYQLTGISYKTYPGSHVFRQSLTSEVKTRRVATPFGFGLDSDEFTPRQWAILGALTANRGGNQQSRR